MYFLKINEKSEQVRNKALTNEHLGYIILITNKRSKKEADAMKKLLLAFMPVSYTHLDVYKRQMYRNVIKGMIVEQDFKSVLKLWQKELDGLKEKYAKTQRLFSGAVVDLAKVEVFNHNRKDLERMLEKENHKRAISKERNITI